MNNAFQNNSDLASGDIKTPIESCGDVDVEVAKTAKKGWFGSIRGFLTGGNIKVYTLM
jgi:hypothetical protein